MLKRLIAVLLIAVITAFALTGCAQSEKEQQPILVKVLILPKFEVGRIIIDDILNK